MCNFEADIAVFVNFFLDISLHCVIFFLLIVEVDNSILDPLISLSMVRYSFVRIPRFNFAARGLTWSLFHTWGDGIWQSAHAVMTKIDVISYQATGHHHIVQHKRTLLNILLLYKSTDPVIQRTRLFMSRSLLRSTWSH